MTDKIWQYLQNHNYFLNHRLYNKFQVTIPSYVDIRDIKDKIILDLGMGFGRHLAWFSLHAKMAYGVEILNKVVQEAKQFIAKHGKLEKVRLYLTNNYEKHLPPLDYVFCRFVFQHITKQQGKDYIDMINRHLKIYGKVNLQFRLGTKVKIEPNKEPIIEYTLEEIDKLLANFEIDNIFINGNHIYILATKLV